MQQQGCLTVRSTCTQIWGWLTVSKKEQIIKKELAAKSKKKQQNEMLPNTPVPPRFGFAKLGEQGALGTPAGLSKHQQTFPSKHKTN